MQTVLIFGDRVVHNFSAFSFPLGNDKYKAPKGSITWYYSSPYDNPLPVK